MRRVEALAKFLDTEDGKNLLAGYKRATNIIRIEEKKDNKSYTGAPDAKAYKQDEERALAAGDHVGKNGSRGRGQGGRFHGGHGRDRQAPALRRCFFDKVTVNVKTTRLRENRLKLLNEIREATGAVADFSKIGG